MGEKREIKELISKHYESVIKQLSILEQYSKLLKINIGDLDNKSSDTFSQKFEGLFDIEVNYYNGKVITKISISKKNDSFQNNFVNYTFIHKLNGNTQNVNYYNSKLQQKSSQVTKSFRTIAASPQKVIQIATIKKTPIKLLSTSKKKNYQNAPNKIGSHSVSKFSCELPAIKNNKKNSYYTSNTNSTNNSLLGTHSSKSPIKRSASNNNMFKNFILKSACKNMKMSNTNLNTFSQTKLIRKSSKFNTIISNIHTKTNSPNTILV